jgi:hypothetical protein
MPRGALSICQVSNQFPGKLVNVHVSEVINLLSLEIEDGRPKDDRYVDAAAVEYFSAHDQPPIEGPRGRGCACWAAIARQIARSGYFPFAFSPTSAAPADKLFAWPSRPFNGRPSFWAIRSMVATELPNAAAASSKVTDSAAI